MKLTVWPSCKGPEWAFWAVFEHFRQKHHEILHLYIFFMYVMYDNVEKYGSMHLETIIFNLGPHIEHKCCKNAIFQSFFNFFLPILNIFHLNTWCESLLWHQLYLTTNGNNISYSDDTLMIARPGIEHKKGKKLVLCLWSYQHYSYNNDIFSFFAWRDSKSCRYLIIVTTTTTPTTTTDWSNGEKKL